MKPLLSRADLLRVAASLGVEGLEAMARAHGYERKAPPPPPKGEAASSSKSEPGASAESSPAVPLAPTPFWQPRSIVFHGEDEARARIRAETRAAEAAEAAGAWRRGTASPPPSPPLSPWRRLGPLLHRALTVDCSGRRLDLPQLVRRIATGRQVTPLPRLRRRGWVPVEVVVDRPLRLAPFWSDQALVVRELEHVLGRQQVAVRVLANGPGSTPDEGAGPRRRPALRGVPVLALTDLGWYAGGDERAAWLRMARTLQAVGEKAIALVPVPRSRWSPELARAWRVIPWERPAAGAADEPELRAARVERLLLHLAPAMQIERGLLRTIRRLLPRAEADVGIEAEVWMHPVLGGMFPEYRVIDPGKVAELRRRFAAEVPVADQARVVEVLRAWHWNCAQMPEAWHLEVLTLERTLSAAAARAAGIAAAEVEQAERFMTWLFRDVEQGGDDEETADTLRRWCNFVVEQAPRSLWDPSTRVGAALQQISFRVGGVDVPDADPKLRGAVDEVVRHEPCEVWIHQAGGALGVTASTLHRDFAGSPLAAVTAASPLITLASAAVQEGTLRMDRPEERLLTRPRGVVEVRTDCTTLRMEPLMRPRWARAIGRDSFGLWAELVFKDVPYRMRWIPPGRFLMGSPENDPERFADEEPQHEVTISRGFWLGETPVTQALWQAVTGENPSRFRTPDRPVEQVSWKDCQKALIAHLNSVLPAECGESFRLPTEAEWEYACRAGTTDATYAGAVEILGDANAPGLDRIAWYRGNSGVDYDLDEGEDSSGWPEKQHNHSKAGTRRVAQKQSNQWGLHDMLGNVWEWCMDGAPGQARLYGYRNAAEQDPVVSARGGFRVIRGGSWSGAARGVRAACRSADHPGHRYSGVGLRLARGQDSHEQGGEAAHFAGVKQVNTRTLAGREAYDAALLETLKSLGGTVAAPELMAITGGTPLQIRAALQRLIERGVVMWTGQARSLRYTAL